MVAITVQRVVGNTYKGANYEDCYSCVLWRIGSTNTKDITSLVCSCGLHVVTDTLQGMSVVSGLL
jgi:hypothetical protein